MLRTGLLACLAGLVVGLGSVSADPITYAVTNHGQFGSLDLGTGDFTPIGDAYPPTFDGLANLPDGTLVIIDGNNVYGQIDPATGTVTPLGLTPVNVTVFASLLSGVLYAVDDQNSLYQIDPGTGDALLIGSTGIPGVDLNTFSNALTGDGSNLYYIYEQGGAVPVPSTLYQLDLTTGLATAIGPTGTTGLVGAGFADGVLYAYRSGAGLHEILTIDVTTGLATDGPPYSPSFLIYGSNSGLPSP